MLKHEENSCFWLQAATGKSDGASLLEEAVWSGLLKRPLSMVIVLEANEQEGGEEFNILWMIQAISVSQLYFFFILMLIGRYHDSMFHITEYFI